MSKPKVKVIAFYLPQYYPTPDNDEWWGKGFTEWTNVGKAKPLFPGHYQPKVPADLGYYDLRLPEIREAQAQLAKEAGIYGFCYYHYWFGNGKMELERPFQEVLSSGKPDFPFMLCWANESWHKKFWNKDGKGSSKEVLIEQTYPGEQDITDHFYKVLPAFKDPRYIKINNKPAFMIYKPFDVTNINLFLDTWNKLALKEGLDGITFIASIWSTLLNDQMFNTLKEAGFYSVNHIGLWTAFYPNTINTKYRIFLNRLLRRPFIKDYSDLTKNILYEIDKKENVYPTLIPNWDHTPRSGKTGTVLVNSTPHLFGKQIEKFLKATASKSENIIFLKSWNEWGEGNYIEPDLKYGKGYIDILKTKLHESK